LNTIKKMVKKNESSDDENEIKLTKQTKDVKNKVKINSYAPTQTDTFKYHSSIPNFDNSFDLKKFLTKLKINILKLNNEEIIFEIINIDASLANTFRRIMIAEVPTMAIEKVVFIDNTGVMTDEILAHRLGLIPIQVDPRVFVERSIKF
jgi:DNA-directed RNA polymerases I and III subunit RPAC1